MGRWEGGTVGRVRAVGRRVAGKVRVAGKLEYEEVGAAVAPPVGTGARGAV